MLSLACWAEAEMIFKASKKKKIFKAAQLGKKGDRETNWQRWSKTLKKGAHTRSVLQVRRIFWELCHIVWTKRWEGMLTKYTNRQFSFHVRLDRTGLKYVCICRELLRAHAWNHGNTIYTRIFKNYKSLQFFLLHGLRRNERGKAWNFRLRSSIIKGTKYPLHTRF